MVVLMGINVTEMFEKGVKGKVYYDKDEDTYKIEIGCMGYDLCQAFWSDYEDLIVEIKIKESDE
jgi:hypothetical protein